MKQRIQNIVMIFSVITVLFLSLPMAAQEKANITLRFDASVATDNKPYKLKDEISMLIEAEDKVEIKSVGIGNPEKWENGEWISYPITMQGSFDIEIYGKVTSFKVEDALVVSLDVSNCPGLKKLSYSAIPLKSIDVSNNRQLEYLACSVTEIPKLSLSNNKRLKYLECSQCELESLELTGLEDLEFLDCSNNKLSALNLKDNFKLNTLRFSSNPIPNIDLSQQKELKFLTATYLPIQTLDLSGLTNLEVVNAGYCQQLGKVVFDKGAQKLKDLEFNDCNLTELDVSGLDALQVISCERNRLAGEGMKKLIESVPDHSFPHDLLNNKIRIIDTSSEKEGNVCTVDQVETLRKKLWDCEDYNGGHPKAYAGSVPAEVESVKGAVLEVFFREGFIEIKNAPANSIYRLLNVEGKVLTQGYCDTTGMAQINTRDCQKGVFLLYIVNVTKKIVM